MGDPCTLTTSSATNSCSNGITVAETPAMQADMSAFYTAYLDQYYSVTTGAFRKAAPGYLIAQVVGSWDAPPRKEALTETAKYVDLPFTPYNMVPAWWNASDSQARVNFIAEYLGDMPWAAVEGFWAQLDSAESPHASANPGLYTTQLSRGAAYQTDISTLINDQDTATGTHHAVGFDWWGWYDSDTQGMNWGLLTPHDNPYDGKSSTISGDGDDQWGYPTGRETTGYGDFLSAIARANHAAESQLEGMRHRQTELKGRNP
jgi:hypothetical protein